MRATLSAVVLLAGVFAFAQDKKNEPILIAKPDAFKTLVNPNCSHCVDEVKRRKDELKDTDPVLCWTRGYSDGGAIPLRFFLNTYRVISDSYGVFVYDPDAGYARGFAPSYNFEFHGWRNGVMVMKDKTDGTIFSCLSGVAVEGKRKGEQLAPIPTMVSTWGEVMGRNPNAVAYHMFEKYTPSELPTKVNEDSVRSQLAKVDPRLKPDEVVLGVRVGNKTRAYPMKHFSPGVSVEQDLGGEKFFVFGYGYSTAYAAYKPVAHQPRKWKAPRPDKNGVSPPDAGEPLPGGKEMPPQRIGAFSNSKVGVLSSGSTWPVDGRASDGDMKGWTLEPVETLVCKWYAWSAEYPDTEVAGEKKAANPSGDVGPAKDKPIAGTAEFLRLLPKPFGVVKAINAKARTVSLLFDGEKTAKVWPVEPDTEVWVNGFWGRLEQFKPDDKVWVWLKLDRKKQPVSVAMMADELSEQSIRGLSWKVLELKQEDLQATQPQVSESWMLQRGEEKKELKFTRVGVPRVEHKLVYLETAGGTPRVVTQADLADRTAAQREVMRIEWIKSGLPGTLTFHHVFSGELEVMLDHEGMRWGRSLTVGDTVDLTADPPIRAVVKTVMPWRERTSVRLVVGELESSELKLGQRIGLKMKAPDKDVDESAYPPDLGRKRTTDERVEWFLASMYCVCGVGKDTCTGHFYTLASCNPNGCGAPTATRDEIRGMIEKGKSDKDIWDSLVKDRGPLMTKPHLKP